ncbi:phosphoglycerate kinase [Patescibacteria group bacterium]
MKLKSLKNANIKNKTALVKVDYNVPLMQKGEKFRVVDNTRIKITLTTIEYLIEQNCKTILMSHLGRPDGKVVEGLRLDPVAKELEKLIKKPIKKLDNVIGKDVEVAIKNGNLGEIFMLENNRFEPGETKNDSKLSKSLASYADIFVNDGFSLSHREHASVSGVAKHLPSYAGFTLQKEVEMLSSLTTKPKRPLVAIVGGAKISDKIDAIYNLAKIADVILVGGGVANNFLKAEGVKIYSSYLQDVVADEKKREVDYVKFAENMLKSTRQEKLLLNNYIPIPKIVYPIDVVAAQGPKHSKSVHTIELTNGNMKEDRNVMYLDIGPKTQKLFKEIILEAETIFWNGPMGMFELKQFEEGTKSVASAIAKSKATTILGGGDTMAAINKFKLQNRYDYVSASGGASLEFLGGKKLPGIEVLKA